MATRSHLHPADLHGLARLAADATGEITDVVEAMHEAIAWPPILSPFQPSRETPGLTGLVYSAIRGSARLVGTGIDRTASPLIPLLRARVSTPERDAFLSILGGVIGDHLAATDNPLAIRMEFRRHGRALALQADALRASLPRVSPRVALWIHGLCGTDAQWKGYRASGSAVDYARSLQDEFDFTPIYLRYNSGLHVSTNGRLLADMLENLVDQWPVPIEELLIVGHSMGGLVARSAFHHGSEAGLRWPSKVRRMAFLGTPHHGAPLERGGNWFEKILGQVHYAAPLARLGRLRSSGITDLRYGNLVDADWHGRDRFERTVDRRCPVPLPANVDCLAVAATTGAEPGDARDRLVGDGLVPLASAHGRHAERSRELGFDPSRRAIVRKAGHMKLLGHPEVQQSLVDWLKS